MWISNVISTGGALVSGSPVKRWILNTAGIAVVALSAIAGGCDSNVDEHRLSGAKTPSAKISAEAQQTAQIPVRQQDNLRQIEQSLRRYSDDLNGWILEALEVLRLHEIPGSYEGIHRNIMRESSGNPNAINLWDSNAAKGIPSKGLLQVIDPTFSAYHVNGTSWDIYDPVANISAACNYAAARYGSIDNVYSAY